MHSFSDPDDPDHHRQSRRVEADLLDHAPVPIRQVDRDGVIRYVSRAETELLGYSTDELVGRHVADLHCDRHVIDALLARLRRGETVRDVEVRMRTRGGSVRHVEITASPQIRGGEAVSFRWFSRDVTSAWHSMHLNRVTAALSHARTEEQIARCVIAEAMRVIGAVAGAVVLLDEAGSAIERFFVEGDVDRDAIESVIAMPLSADIPICEAARGNKVVWHVGAAALDARYPHLASMRASNNAHTWGAVPIVFEGRRLGAIGVRCNVERPLEADDATLLLAVGRECGLAVHRARQSEALEAARQRAERANVAKDEFLAMLGHELRNPLSPILTAVQLMRLRGDHSTAREQNIIERQINHLIHIVDDLLDISRIAQGKARLDTRPVRIATVISKAVEMIASSSEERQHQLTVDIPDEDLWVEADETRLCQVITNLLTNSIKYTNPGGHLELRVQRDRDRVNICVKDDGNGISRDLLPQIFDLFVQEQRATERSRGGLGVGLALVRSLVTMHGGTVTAHSPGLGRGSEFVVRLPLIDLRRVPPPTEADRNLRHRVEVTRRRILIVDDNQDASELLGEMLRNLGHEVVVAHDGGRALDSLELFTPEVAVLDIGLPDTDGYQLARSLRAQLGSNVRLMAVTGYGQQKDVAQAQLSGFDHHFTKPVGLGKIIAAIEVDRTSPPDS